MKDPKAAERLKKATRSIKDYPKKGIIFRDLTTILQDGECFSLAIDMLEDFLIDPKSGERIYDKLAGVEARGFILAGALAGRLGGGVVMIRKPGKLPFTTISEDYQLEYGKDRLEIHQDAIVPGERVILIDDLLATGGTATAGAHLIERLKGKLIKFVFLVELPELGGRSRLSGYPVDTVISFEGH